MIRRIRLPRPARRTAVAFVLVLSCAIYAAPSIARAQNSLQTDTSLALVPADAGWYSSSLRLGEQWDAFAESRAYQRLVEHPWVALGIARARAEWENPENEEIAVVRQWLERPENKELVDLAKAGLREEVFLVGDGSAAKLLLLWNRITSAQQIAAIEASLTGGDAEQAGMRAVLETLEEHQDELVVPSFTIGVRAGESPQAAEQIARAEDALREVLADQPQLIERLGKETIAGHEFLIWRLEGELLPWDQWAAEVPEENRPLFEQFREMIREKTLVVALGIWDEYVLLAFGPDTAHLERLGTGPLLVSTDTFAPLREAAADERLVSIGYASNDFLSALNLANLQQIENMARFAETFVDAGGGFAGLPDDLQLELKADIRKLAETIKQHVPNTGAVLSFTYLVPQGYESFTYNWGEQRGIDPTKPLPILEHTGGNPILAAAKRKLYQPEQYDAFARGLRRVGYYIDRLAEQFLNEPQRAWYERFQTEGTPLVHRFNKATSDLLLPALADGQVAVVLDADEKAPSWHVLMPTATEPLPLPAIGLVLGVSDADQLERAGAEYRSIVQEALERLRTAVQDASESGDLPPEVAEQFPDVQIQPPQTRELDTGKLYWYVFPPHWGLSEELALTAALTEQYVAFSLLPSFTERLIEEHPLSAFGLLEDADQALASAVVFDFAGLVEAARPWVGYIVPLSQGVQPADAEGDQVVQTLTEQINSLLDIAACFRGAAAVTYRERDVFITRSVVRFEDLAESD